MKIDEVFSPSPIQPREKVLLVNMDKLKNESYIDENVSEKHLRVAINAIQNEIIEKVIGTSLFNQLAQLVCQGTFNQECNLKYKVLMDDYLFRIFVYAVQAELSIPLSFKNRNTGTIQPETDSSARTSISDIKYLNQYYINKADEYIQRTIKFLLCNRSEYPELERCDCSWCSGQLINQLPHTLLNLKVSPHEKTTRRKR
ncbi:MAG: hypothetical protein LUE93_13395 [Bacteroides sp.]|nr:hypothetical protein [Bacteroides sp.]